MSTLPNQNNDVNSLELARFEDDGGATAEGSQVPRCCDLRSALSKWPEVLTAKDVAKAFQMSHKTILQYRTRGLLKGFKFQSNVRFLKSDVLSFMEKRHGR
jgi:hypothetical protein